MQKSYRVAVYLTPSDNVDSKAVAGLKTAISLSSFAANCDAYFIEEFDPNDKVQGDLVKKMIDQRDFCLVVDASRSGAMAPAQFLACDLVVQCADKKKVPRASFVHAQSKTFFPPVTLKTMGPTKQAAEFLGVLKQQTYFTWSTDADLGNQLKSALIDLIRIHSPVGLIPSDTPVSKIGLEMYEKLQHERKRNAQLMEKGQRDARPSPSTPNPLIPGTEPYFLPYAYKSVSRVGTIRFHRAIFETTGDAIRMAIGHPLYYGAPEDEIVDLISVFIESNRYSKDMQEIEKSEMVEIRCLKDYSVNLLYAQEFIGLLDFAKHIELMEMSRDPKTRYFRFTPLGRQDYERLAGQNAGQDRAQKEKSAMDIDAMMKIVKEDYTATILGMKIRNEAAKAKEEDRLALEEVEKQKKIDQQIKDLQKKDQQKKDQQKK